MPRFIREDIDSLNVKLTVIIEPADYQTEWQKELDKIRKNVPMRGFRKGKAPLGLIRGMHGRQVLYDTVMRTLEEKTNEYFQAEKINMIFGEPLNSEDQPELDFSAKSPRDFEFRFDLGLRPEFELTGLEPPFSYHRYDVEVPHETAIEQIERWREQLADATTIEEAATEEHRLSITVREMENDAIKENGMESEIMIILAELKPGAARDQLLGKKAGDKVIVNFPELYDPEQYPRDYVIEEILFADAKEITNDFFEVEIEAVQQFEKPALDQDFFDKIFEPDTVHTEAEAIEEVREIIKQRYDPRVNALLMYDIQEQLLAQNVIPLPDIFLRRWMDIRRKNQDEPITEEAYEHFEQGVRWSLIKSKLADQFDITITEQDLKAAFAAQVQGYFGGYPGMEQFVESMVERMMQDSKQVNEIYENILTDRLLDGLLQVVHLNPLSISAPEFEKIFAEIQAKVEAEQQAQAWDDEEEE
ncbi:MAG TPA: trigger factor [Saprospiraceae bacterium]|nr:trigger factor [Saprospiraceae bacterium]HMP25642.1 trigger factor [Saprospiraceae bacterium]